MCLHSADNLIFYFCWRERTPDSWKAFGWKQNKTIWTCPPVSYIIHPSQSIPPSHPTAIPWCTPSVRRTELLSAGRHLPRQRLQQQEEGQTPTFINPLPTNAFWQIFQLSFIMNSRRCFLLHFLIEKWCILWCFPWFSFYCPTCTEQMKWGQAGMSHCRWGRRGLGEGNWDQIESRMAEQGCEDEDKAQLGWQICEPGPGEQGECPDMDTAAIHLQGFWGCGQAWVLQHQISSKRKKIILKSNQ